MSIVNAPPRGATDRLRTLILFAGLKEETVAEARALGPALAGDLVADLIDAEVSRPSMPRTAVRAAHLARELELVRAIPALVRCVASRGDGEALSHAAVVVLERLGAPALDALLSAFDASRDTSVRCRLAVAIARSPVENARARAALLRLLADAPANAAWCLGDRGEWRAVPDLLRAFDRLAESPIADCAGCAAEHLSTIASAVRVLGGSVSPDRQAKIDALATSADVAWVHFSVPVVRPVAPAIREQRPDRNDPCPCGSGKKYRCCCAAADPGDERH